MSTKEISNNKSSVSLARKIAVGAMLSAIGCILMFISTATPVAPDFLKIDLSDLPALLASFALGPQWGVLVALVKNLLHLPATTTSGIGELSNFILCSSFVIPAGLIYSLKKTKKVAIISVFIGLIIMSAMALPSNLYVIYPLYYKIGFAKEALIGLYAEIANKVFPFMNLDNSIAKCILYFNVPFTFVKGLLSTIIAILIYQPLRPLLKGKN